MMRQQYNSTEKLGKLKVYQEAVNDKLPVTRVCPRKK